MSESIWWHGRFSGEFEIGPSRAEMANVHDWDVAVEECLRKALAAKETISVKGDADVTAVFGIFEKRKMLAQFGRIPFVRAQGDSVNMTMGRILKRTNWVAQMRSLGLI